MTSVGPNHDDSMTSWTADVISGASQRYKDEPAKVKMLLTVFAKSLSTIDMPLTDYFLKLIVQN